jgi:hypothetical protein
MLGNSIHASHTAHSAHPSPKTARSAAVLGALLLTAVAINALIVVVDLRARADSSAVARNLAQSVCQANDHTVVPHPFRGALAPSMGCTTPRG